jgi:hypothetical protein
MNERPKEAVSLVWQPFHPFQWPFDPKQNPAFSLANTNNTALLLCITDISLGKHKIPSYLYDFGTWIHDYIWLKNVHNLIG